MYQNERVRIPYEEYKAIGEIVRAHLKTHEGQLRAVVAFGDLVTRGGTFDIDLLEVVEGWQGQASLIFESTAELPLRGVLCLYFLTPEEFEHPERLDSPFKRRLMDRVREGYDIVYEDPPVYGLDTLERTKPRATGKNPLNALLSSGAQSL